MKFGLKALPATSRIVTTRCGPLEVGEAGQGHSVIAIHGGGAGWDHGFVISERFAADYRLIVPSRPGYLRTPLETGATFEQQAEAIIAMMDAIHVHKAALFAHSAGGPVAYLLAARYPDRFWALIAEAAIASPYQGEPLQPIRPIVFTLKERVRLWRIQRAPLAAVKSFVVSNSRLAAREVERTAEAIVADPLRLRHFLLLKQTTYPTVTRRPGHQNDREQLAALNALPIADIRIPTFLCHGRVDGDVPVTESEAVAKILPGSELFICEDGFHLMMLAASWRDIVYRQMAFLKQHGPRV